MFHSKMFKAKRGVFFHLIMTEYLISMIQRIPLILLLITIIKNTISWSVSMFNYVN